MPFSSKCDDLNFQKFYTSNLSNMFIGLIITFQLLESPRHVYQHMVASVDILQISVMPRGEKKPSLELWSWRLGLG